MDSVPATVPSVTSSPGDPELLGPLSVLYAALIAKLLEVTVPTILALAAGGRVLSGVGALTGGARRGWSVRPQAGRTLRCCVGDGGGGVCSEKVLSHVLFFEYLGCAGYRVAF